MNFILWKSITIIRKKGKKKIKHQVKNILIILVTTVKT